MSWLPTATLFAMMLALGMELRPADFARLKRSPAVVAFGLLGQLVLLPLVAFTLAHALRLPETMAIGLVLIAACPGGVTSNLLTSFARGDVALSISLTAASSLVCFVSVPFVFALAMQHFGSGREAIALSASEAVSTLFLTTATPVGLGMLVRHRHPGPAARIRGPLLGVSTAVLLLLIVGLAVTTFGSGRDMAALTRKAGPAVLLLIAVTTGIGLAGARALGAGATTARTLALEIGIQNFNLALVVAVSLCEEPLYAGPAVLYLPAMLAFGGLLVALGRRAARAEPG